MMLPFGASESTLYIVTTVERTGEPFAHIFFDADEYRACYEQQVVRVRAGELMATKGEAFTISASLGFVGGGSQKRKEATT